MFSFEAFGGVRGCLDLDKVDEMLRVGFAFEPKLVLLHSGQAYVRIEIIPTIIEIKQNEQIGVKMILLLSI
jgi:hypothetical protein